MVKSPSQQHLEKCCKVYHWNLWRSYNGRDILCKVVCTTTSGQMLASATSGPNSFNLCDVNMRIHQSHISGSGDFATHDAL